MRRALVGLWVIGVAALLGAFVLDRHLQAAPDDWATPVRIGPFERRWQVAATLRLATKPVVARLLDGHGIATTQGRLTLRREPSGVLRATCAPCVIRSSALGGAPLRLTAVAIDLTHAEGDDYAGRAWLGRSAGALPVTWRARFDARGLVVDANASALPIASLLEAIEPRLPELDRARIAGTLSFTLRYGGDPSRGGDELASRLRIEPRIDGFTVTGLGTEVLLGAAPPERCGPATAPLRGWLPVAVVAAEDQAFFSHAGVDVDTVRTALLTNVANGTIVGGSSLTQQLAKLIYTGDRRDPARKLREMLYAADMERALGKGRILQLYLAIAPWGAGLCGAERASQHYFGKPAARLDPLEAAWLAGLLRNPDAALEAMADDRAIDVRRTGWVLSQMRPMAPWRRAYWSARVVELRPAGALPSAAKPSTSR